MLFRNDQLEQIYYFRKRLMITNSNQTLSVSQGFALKAKAYFELLKFRLSFLVTFSSGIGYALAAGSP